MHRAGMGMGRVWSTLLVSSIQMLGVILIASTRGWSSGTVRLPWRMRLPRLRQLPKVPGTLSYGRVPAPSGDSSGRGPSTGRRLKLNPRLATTLSPDEAEDVIRRGLDKGAERPRDLGRLGNGDLGRLGNGDVVGANSCPKPKPMVIISVDEHKTGDQACAALKADPEIYQRGGLLVRVLVEADYPEQVIHAAGAPKIAPVPLPNLRERLVRCGDWRKRQTDAKGKTVLRRAHPPTWAIKAVDDARGVGRRETPGRRD